MKGKLHETRAGYDFLDLMLKKKKKDNKNKMDELDFVNTIHLCIKGYTTNRLQAAYRMGEKLYVISNQHPEYIKCLQSSKNIQTD